MAASSVSVSSSWVYMSSVIAADAWPKYSETALTFPVRSKARVAKT